MAIMETIKIPINISISMTTIAITFYTVIELMMFLSDPHYKLPITPRGNFWVNASLSLFINQLLLSAFILQHTILALPSVKSWFSTLKIAVIQRSIYVITTAIALQLVIKYWQTIPEFVLWSINTNVRMYWWSFLLLHILAWTVIYVGTICMDINELLGVKQIYYNIRKLPDPCEYKSRDLKRLYLHMRHPSFLGFLVIFWAVPCMSLDRLLLASVLSAYMYLAWNTDEGDHRYQKMQTERKFYELNYLK
ncbi:hypothetical protein RN001_014861 [Aquatica leii]|uniref:Nuclear envelope membrane protein n=1 Tax=Aquatica leii TaxID=1421715 RepID=A0AAN7NYB9_9COLE|nr:hypothetical protein RN001_014861 [Aquatica leii]